MHRVGNLAATILVAIKSNTAFFNSLGMLKGLHLKGAPSERVGRTVIGCERLGSGHSGLPRKGQEQTPIRLQK
jgi:hypothetical protein